MSEIRFNRWSHQSGTGGIYQDSSGNIGIGTSVPTSVLDIQGGSIKIGNDLLTSSGVSTFTSGLNVTGGSVGIGTDNPTKSLDIRTDSGVLIRGRTGLLDANLSFQPTTGGRQLTLRTVSSSFELYDTSAASSRMYWNYDGRTGINTNNPGTELHVQGTNGYAELRLSGNSGSGGSLEYFDSTTKLADIYADPSSNLVFRNTASNTERLRIDSSGHLIMPAGNFDLMVGDSTNSNAGTQTISVGSTASGSGGIQIWANPTNGNSWVQFGDNSASASHYRGWINYQHADDNLNFGAAGTERLRIDSSGRVTMPYQPLAVVGKTSAQTSTGDIVFEKVWHNVGSHYNDSTGVFTCPVAGYYYTHIMIMSNGTDHTMDINLHVNGSYTNQLVPYQTGTGGSYNQVSGSTIIYCAANDNLRYYVNAGSVYGGTSGRHSSAIFHLVG
jgi:hypothetical protein